MMTPEAMQAEIARLKDKLCFLRMLVSIQLEVAPQHHPPTTIRLLKEIEQVVGKPVIGPPLKCHEMHLP